jgi:hypothetical protein
MRTQAFVLLLVACPLLAAADPKDDKPLAVTADQLTKDFQDDDDATLVKKYADKTIEVTGAFYQYGDASISLRGKSEKPVILCVMQPGEIDKLQKAKVPTETTTLTVTGQIPKIAVSKGPDEIQMRECKVVKVEKKK